MAKRVTCLVVLALAVVGVLVHAAGAQGLDAADDAEPTGTAGRLFDHFGVKGGVITWSS